MDGEIKQNDNTGRVLIVDDETDVLEIISEFLQLNHFQTLTTNRPEQVVDMIARFHPHIILSDLRMPKMNGTEMLAAVREVASDVPVAFVSGYIDKFAMDPLPDGVVAVLEKPLNFDRLLQICRQAANRKP